MTQCTPSFRLLDESQIRKLHEATLELLENVGVLIQHDEALDLLAAAGCTVSDGVARIPGALVAQCLSSAPASFDVYDSRGRAAMKLGSRNNYFGMGTDLLRTLDIQTGELRASILQDVVNAARVADACPQFDFIASYALPHDVPTNTMYIECFKAEVEHSTKPIFFTAAGPEDLAVIAAMAEAVAGGEENLREKPFLIHYAEPTSPLRHTRGAVAKLFLCAEKRIPVNYTPAMLLGATAPVTIAGGIVQANAEALSGLVMHQLKAPGAPIISGFAVPAFEMAATTPGYGSPELRLAHAACSDLFRSYGIPMWDTAGATESHCLDIQAGMEWSYSLLAAALSGSNLIHDVGYMGQGLIGCPAALVMCDELIGGVRRFMRGFDINETTLARDVIERVGPGGTYLAEEHTLRNYRQELWRARLLNRDNPDIWLAKGAPDLAHVATARAREILARREAPVLSPEICHQLSALLTQAEAALMTRSFGI